MTTQEFSQAIAHDRMTLWDTSHKDWKNYINVTGSYLFIQMFIDMQIREYLGGE